MIFSTRRMERGSLSLHHWAPGMSFIYNPSETGEGGVSPLSLGAPGTGVKLLGVFKHFRWRGGENLFPIHPRMSAVNDMAPSFTIENI